MLPIFIFDYLLSSALAFVTYTSVLQIGFLFFSGIMLSAHYSNLCVARESVLILLLSLHAMTVLEHKSGLMWFLKEKTHIIS